ncbi:ComEC family competence protein [Sphingosinithalassobacter tenebrarum]|uniref:ComEC family competence protein n=1 Tax=Stakelama tenebrarum TaxID=2711215 RepID=A0A6G6YAQ1_9SPHN|nr:ComEC family competence protein [Sphingosinithalassobacter tenebrarum]
MERWLEAERDQLPLWIPVLLGSGIAAWFALARPEQWWALIFAAIATALFATALAGPGRAVRGLAVGAALVALGCGLIWWRAERVAAPVLTWPGVFTLTGEIVEVEPLPARELLRVTLATDPQPRLPPKVRVNIAEKDLPDGTVRGASLKLRSWLMPPPPAMVPGAYDFSRVAWFEGLGATGRAFDPVEVIARGPNRGEMRHRLADHVRSRLDGGAGAIAATLATGDRGGISDGDAEAMRRSGLAHLLSISGLHVTAVTGATMLLVLRALALSPWLALRVRLPLVAAGAGALAAIGYTILTGAQVPTVRSCAAALLVLLAMALGREAITLRLIAAGALIVLLLWPESLAGPSFQLSFAAVTAIVALHESALVRRWIARREEAWWRRAARILASLLLTGLVVEVALMPIALFHFHKAGIYGALANVVAIPLTTFVVMPLEALALLFDVVGLGAPFWWLTGLALDALLALAHATANAPGSVASLPTMARGAFVAMVAGGLWLALWRTRVRFAGLIAIAGGVAWAVATPAPDIIIGGQGKHMALRLPDGRFALLRGRAGDYTRAMFGETAGSEQELATLADQPGARCSKDICVTDIASGGRDWRVAATRTDHFVPYPELIALCSSVDIFVSDRRLPEACAPRWLKADPALLRQTGGLALTLRNPPTRRTVLLPGDAHPWVVAARPKPRRTSPSGGASPPPQ